MSTTTIDTTVMPSVFNVGWIYTADTLDSDWIRRVYYYTVVRRTDSYVSIQCYYYTRDGGAGQSWSERVTDAPIQRLKVRRRDNGDEYLSSPDRDGLVFSAAGHAPYTGTPVIL